LGDEPAAASTLDDALVLGPAAFDGLVGTARVVVCVGTGGVGKTTTAAAIALHGAASGRRAVVITIDPARRLADALGIAAIGNEPRHIEGPWSGELFAVMLDTRGTFDTLVARYAADDAQRDRILANAFYQNVAGALSGTQDYMAMEKLYELHESGRFDLIVVDTPPTRHALAFLDAPRLLTRLLENRVYRVLMAPRGVVRAVNSAAQLFVRQVTRLVGTSVVDDAIAFFRAFEGMEEGFTQRADRVFRLLRSDDAAFVLVAAPRADTVAETRFFTEQLRSAGIAVRALVVNRMTPRSVVVADPPVAAQDLPHARAAREFAAAARAEAEQVEALLAGLGRPVVVAVPLLDGDVHDLDGVGRIEALLFSPGPSDR
jgi:anion-transporting  ArsA/GET3 family ATPase